MKLLVAQRCHSGYGDALKQRKFMIIINEKS